ncbi:MAG: GNAT family N-acetyltransferase [Sulfitobacter sp.]
MEFTISKGFDDTERPVLADLFWGAFGSKLGSVLGPSDRAKAFLAQVLDPSFAIVARNPKGQVLGVSGFKTANGAFVGGGLREFASVYGWLGTLWRVPALSLLERDVEEGALLMDGICVAETGRGQGIGTALLNAIKAEARVRNLAHIRLDVIDSNPRAEALYLREGFIAKEEQSMGPLRHIFGFDRSKRMEFQVA